MNIELFELPILFISIFANVSIAFLVVQRSNSNWTNWLFALLNTAWIGWTVATYLSLDMGPYQLELVRLSMLFVVMMNTVFFYFVHIFQNNNYHFSQKHKLLLLFSIIVAGLTVSPWLFQSVELSQSGAISPQPGPAILLFVVHVVITVIGAIKTIINRLKTSQGVVHAQFQFILAGTFLFFTIVPLTNFILPIGFGLSSFVVFSPVAPLVFAIFIGYTIVRHRLFDIRLIVARSVAYLLLLTTLSVIYASVIFSVSSLALADNSFDLSSQFINVAAAIVLAFTFQPLKRFFDRVTNRIFYRDAYNAESVIRQVNDVVLSSLALEGLLFGVVHTLSKELRISAGLAGIKQVKNVTQTTVTSGDIKIDEKIVSQIGIAINKFDQRVLLTDDIEDQELQSTLRDHNIDIIARIVADPTAGDEGLGYLAFGPKRSGSLYASKDINLLDIIAGELVVAVQNALRFEEISQFNEQLTQRINEATQQLQEKNQKLRELDQAKDDFISMASHQLRTPLTTVKGYLSMLDDGDLGKLSKQQQEIVKLAFTSSERMAYLISDLLNASRINTGKFTIQREPTKLKKLIKNEIKQLQITAEARDITLKPELSDQDPTLNIDPNKLRQVVMNFIDNAIYYSKSGSEVTVSYTVDKDSVELRVIDSGIGVPESERANLFSKFYRAENAKRVRPDGTGLGLFLAKKVITAHGGSIIFESEVGQGSTFGFRFALSTVATTDKPTN